MRLVAALIALYLLIDFSDPGLPGAFTFDAEDSVEAVHNVQKVSGPARFVAIAPQPASTAASLPAPPPRGAVVVSTQYAAPRHRRTLFRPRLAHRAPEEAAPASLAA